ncbi:hypothetical protein [Streptomyces varsoviensis]|uniref:Uncharacterized protein n=1 Tax=Streptomyces varsoviensis TaxID=67373 RepID=A0ABR5JBM9_9ACTN|nr:hypothetical protein [Streptomyces varsoviensis]KOG90863.1 hypothetical protein ADK38_06290 [Streptomyces varsoviensis]
MNGGAQATFRLERGATGFRHRKDPPLPSTDPRACRAAWYYAARAASGDVDDFAEGECSRNFHTATLTNRHGPHTALFHAHHPLVAFVAAPAHAYTDEFQEPPAWSAVLNASGFTVLSAAQLLSPLTPAATSALSPAELHQITYWQPPTIGATLFNSWD